VWHPAKYAELLAKKMMDHKASVWLVNTGWSGGAYGIGKRMKLSVTRSIIDAIHSGSLLKAPSTKDPIFGIDIVTKCPGVPDEVLIPQNTWGDKDQYLLAAQKLAGLFKENFEKYQDGVTAEVRAAGPR